MSGELFWTGARRPPKFIPFDSQDRMCFDFVYYGANLFAAVFGLESIKDKKYVNDCLLDYQPQKSEFPSFETKEIESEDLQTALQSNFYGRKLLIYSYRIEVTN